VCRQCNNNSTSSSNNSTAPTIAGTLQQQQQHGAYQCAGRAEKAAATWCMQLQDQQWELQASRWVQWHFIGKFVNLQQSSDQHQLVHS
jgi:hypothetical protein